MRDVVDDPSYAEVKLQLIALLKRTQKELGDPMDIDHPEAVSDRNDY